jgi:Asp-tRNA(Asn)/Glu-tRNA(Gln) amidotransferase A subunit family amidase
VSVPTLAFSSVVELSAFVRRREVSPVELAEACVRRIDGMDGALHAYITVARERARESARVAERALMRGEEPGPVPALG